MTGIRTLEENIARLEEATARADESTRAARAALKDLEHKRKEMADLLERLAPMMVEEAIGELVKEGLDQLGEQFKEASQETYNRVLAQTDILLNLALGKPGSTRPNTEDIRPKLAAMIRAWIVEEVRKA